MIKFSLKIILGFLCTLFVKIGLAQHPFANDIKAFESADSINPPPQHAIVFTGSSSFTKWKDVQAYFPEYKIINRGFGGSQLNDVILYLNQVVFAYHPKQVVIYCGDNDLAASENITADTVLKRFEKLFDLIRAKLPKANIVFVSIKPSPSRLKLMAKADEANSLVKNFLHTKPNTAFADEYHAMLNADGTPIKEIFVEDNLHMNAKGYAIWQKVLQPYLLK